MKNDQWFSPGDRVMRVSSAAALGFPYRAKIPESGFGKILCVAGCWQTASGWNAVKFVGVLNSSPDIGFLAACFRRVEEIRLCVEAAKRMRQPVEEEAMTEEV